MYRQDVKASNVRHRPTATTDMELVERHARLHFRPFAFVTCAKFSKNQ